MVYLMLACAILAEVLATTSMKFSDGFTRLWPTLGTAAGYAVAFALLAQTLRSMPVGTVYAIWSGVGTAAIALIGMVFIGEAVNAARIVGILLVVAGVVVLNLGGGGH
ncbi:QacE family quaternary ammonium compound efflux SMR transporter [Streptomyces sp. TRM43335]|uniref:QacE family quaternary ammonium compound efflux SMR transporter n=1 Tax=Streptomyces taklimakanensis TaxID=2569853 RepID=A0A6G2B8D6_9ACTN|nr:multidrug efflux SMR transporter [Streptomyces taklimakanensis]MTE18518.1 QacE family quaternary ammonium compound efflux SMR transporter [Streptomyces taklimakanensis]